VPFGASPCPGIGGVWKNALVYQAGWYPDPGRRHDRRWWDGNAWSDRVADGGVELSDPLGKPPPGLISWVGPEIVDTPRVAAEAVTADPNVVSFPPTGGGDASTASLPLVYRWSPIPLVWAAPFVLGFTVAAIVRPNAVVIGLDLLVWLTTACLLVLWLTRVRVLSAGPDGVTLLRPPRFRRRTLPWAKIQAIEVVRHSGNAKGPPYKVLRIRTTDDRLVRLPDPFLPVAAETAAKQLAQRWCPTGESGIPPAATSG